MADVGAAPHRARGATTTPFAVFDVPAASAAAPVPAALIAAAAVLIGVSAHLSATLAYFAAFAASLVPVARAAWPEEVDGVLALLDARLRRWARAALDSARADLEADTRRLRYAARGNPVLAPVYDRTEETALVATGAGALRSRAEAAWRDHRGAARAAWFLLGLVPRASCWLVAGLVEEAYDGAVARAPAVLSCLRGVVKEVRKRKSVDAVVQVASGMNYSDMSCLIKAAGYVVLCADVLVYVPFRFWVPCVAVTCFAALTVAERVSSLLEEDDSSNEPTRAAGVVSNKVPESWRYLWFLTIAAHVADVRLVRLVLGARPVAVAFLAFCNVKVINVGKKVQGTPDGEGVNGGAERWRRVVTAVLAASAAKVLAIHVLLGFRLAALSLASLGVTAVLLLIREENLSDLEDKKDGEEGAANGIAGGAEEEVGEVKAEHPETTIDDAEAIGDGSEERVQEQRHEEPDHSSSSMDDWDVVEMDDFDGPRVADQS